MNYVVHPSSYIDEGCVIGDGTRIWHFSHVMAGCTIGAACNIGQNVVISPGVVIGSNVKIQNNVSVYDAVRLEDDVFCGPSMVFTNVYNPRSAVNRKAEYRQTLVRRGATLGANCTIVCGVTVGEHAFVGAGAVVNRDVAPFAQVRPQVHVGPDDPRPLERLAGAPAARSPPRVSAAPLHPPTPAPRAVVRPGPRTRGILPWPCPTPVNPRKKAAA